jgi:hypothetical protein
MRSDPEGDLVLLRRCADNIEASSLRSLLGAHDIQSFLRGEQHRSMLGLMGSYVDVDVLVASADLQRAQELLAATPSPDAEEEPEAGVGEGDEGPLSSAEAAEHDRRRRARRRAVGWGILLIFFGPILIGLIGRVLAG